MALIESSISFASEIKADQVPLPPQLPENDTVKELVLKDLNRAEYYLLAKGMSVEWDADDRLYLFRVPQGFWEGSSVPRASLGVPLIYEHIESLMPQVMSALFADQPPFEIIARARTKQDVARAAKELINYQLDQMGFREELRKCIKELMVYGTCYMRLGWRRYKKPVRKRVRRGVPKVAMVNNVPVKTYEKGDGKWMMKTEMVQVNEPFCESVHVRYIIPDPKLRCPDVRKSQFLIHREYMGVEALERAFRTVPGNLLPDTETLKSYFDQPKESPERSLLEGRSTTSVMNTGISSLDLNMEFKAMPRYQESTADPNKEQLEVIEYWNSTSHYVLLNRKLVIINEQNSFNEICYRSCCFTDVLDSFFGIGLARLLKGEQRLQQGVINGRLDDLSLRLSGSFIRVRGSNTPAQQLRLRPGGIMDTDNADGIKMIEYPPALMDAFTEVEASDARAQRRSGANELITQGGQQGPSSITRTATGMNALSAGVGARLGYLIDFISDLIFVPTLEFIQECNSKWLDEETISSILTDELAHDYQGDMLDVVNAKIKFRMLASAKAKARQALAQNMMPMLQIFQQQAVQEAMQLQGVTVDWLEIAQAIADISEIAGTQKWIRLMNQKEEAALRQKNEFAQQMAMEAFKNKNQLQQIAAKGQAQSGTAVVKGLVDELKEGADPISGAPNEDQGDNENASPSA
jgi:hypothetical protein